MDKQQAVETLQQILPDILSGTPVLLAYLYGSVANENALPNSDTDIALLMGQSNIVMTAKERWDLEFMVAYALETKGIFNPDVRIMDDAPLVIRGEVARGVLLYSNDEEVRVTFETQTWKSFIDYEAKARLMRETFFDNVKTYGLLFTR